MTGRALVLAFVVSFAAVSLAVPRTAEAQQGSDEASQRFSAGVATGYRW